MPNKNKETEVPQCVQTSVSGSVFISYRFKITSKQNNSVLGTGSFKVSKEMTDDEQLDFFHQYTHGFYLKQQNLFINVEINKEIL